MSSNHMRRQSSLLLLLLLCTTVGVISAENTEVVTDHDDYYYYYYMPGNSGSGDGGGVVTDCGTLGDDEDLADACSIGIHIVANTNPPCDNWLGEVFSDSSAREELIEMLSQLISGVCQCSFAKENLHLRSLSCHDLSSLVVQANLTKPSDYKESLQQFIQDINTEEANLPPFALSLAGAAEQVRVNVTSIGDGTIGGITTTTDPPFETVGPSSSGSSPGLIPGEVDMGGVLSSAVPLVDLLSTIVVALTLSATLLLA